MTKRSIARDGESQQDGESQLDDGAELEDPAALDGIAEIEPLVGGGDDVDEVASMHAAMAAPEGAVYARSFRRPASAEITAGDVDAHATEESGEEAVGGSNPTPDQDNVDEIGESLGVTYQPGEPLHTTEKIARRDVDRWELHPASSEDFVERRNLEHALPPRPRRAR